MIEIETIRHLKGVYKLKLEALQKDLDEDDTAAKLKEVQLTAKLSILTELEETAIQKHDASGDKVFTLRVTQQGDMSKHIQSNLGFEVADLIGSLEIAKSDLIHMVYNKTSFF